jgi:hypothetical protein
MSAADDADPAELEINAWTGASGSPRGGLSPTGLDWGLQQHAESAPQLLVAEEPPDLREWRDDRVGWGVIAADNDDLTVEDRAAGKDLPESLRTLVDEREGAQVFRYREDLGVGYLRVYDARGNEATIGAGGGGDRGHGPGRLPRYLLIYGPPTAVPWKLQYSLNPVSFVGRLDLPVDALDLYIEALRTDWRGADADVRRPLVWSVDHGSGDITTLMRQAVAEPISRRFQSDDDLRDGAVHLAGAAATADELATRLAAEKPGLVVTTSHGAIVADSLGLLVDQSGSVVQPGTLLARWQPNGAIWYAQACCSAGSDGENRYRGLAADGSPLERTLNSVAALGAHTALLPTALLSATPPLRAFVGHVEPTFNWTLRDPATGQILSAGIADAIYSGMYRARPEPVGLALQPHFEPTSQIWTDWWEAKRTASQGQSKDERDAAQQRALQMQLTVLDRQGMVILGDPTACLPSAQAPR